GAGFDNGYLYTYVANESSVSNSVSVYFDDFYIRHTQAAQGLQAMQTEEYYPFGAIASSYQREGSLENKRLYQSKELIKDLGLEQYDFGPRQYDSWTCHTTTHDPHAESYYEWSPYSWAFNNPVRYGDPTGKDPIDKALGFLSAVVDNALGGITPLRSIAATYVTDAKDFNTGQDGGDVFSIVSGIMEAETGTGLTTGGTVVTVGTGGLGSEVGVPAAATGLALTAHGAVTTLAGANNLVNQKGRLNAEGKNNQGSGEGRGKNNRKPDSDATGDHTVSNDRGSTTYQKNEKNPSGFQEVKRVDTKGKADNGVPTPHVHENGKVRPARPDEIPKTDLSKNKLPNQN
ncbi:MAG: hypothetical protein K1X47_12360, partial [Cyclobacteriaceae bacterium]|nr:hypothetical protein [Cyclobacteriaceae bacterium]